jgi:hypothetical protein
VIYAGAPLVHREVAPELYSGAHHVAGIPELPVDAILLLEVPIGDGAPPPQRGAPDPPTSRVQQQQAPRLDQVARLEEVQRERLIEIRPPRLGHTERLAEEAIRE